jgi:uncharacterized protein RhaS with RHS repeats
VSGQFTQADPIGIAGGMNAFGFAGGDPVNYSDPFGLCPQEDQLCHWVRAGLILAGSDIGGVLGGGAGMLTGPGALVASPAGAYIGMAGGAAVGGAVGELIDRMYFSAGEPRSGKSAEEYDNHVSNKQTAESRLRDMEEKLSNTKGPKAQRPIRDMIEKLKAEVRGHEKEIRQKWPNGRPE